MTSQTNEQAFESTVESMLLAGGWRAGDLAEWDTERALFPARAVAFLRETQPQQWAAMAALHGANLEPLIVEALLRELDLKGSLHVLRHGFKFYGKTFRLASFKAAHGLNAEALAQFTRNSLTVTRQVPCRPGSGDSIDLVFALNGVPVATCELKNPMTGQSWRDAVGQYQQDRDPNAPLFRFQKRALVHFAADPNEVHMTTRLAGQGTRFLPFNRGSHPGGVHCGAGNPQDPSGYSSGYFWRAILERERFLDILGSYVFVERREEKVEDARGARTVQREAVIFPRYHQLDAVGKLVAAAEADGPGRNYLIQHSAGSGKTNSISWLSHRLASLHTADDAKVFDCVVVITDRRVLDQQLQDAIYQIEHAQGVVKAIDQDSQQLAQALVDGTKIVITTLQKFPFVMRGLLRVAGADAPNTPTAAEQSQAVEWRTAIAGRRYAVIVDEAHSSQTGASAREMKAILGARAQAAGEDAEDWQDGLNAVVESRGPQPNLSFFAFTATPKGKTVELFGRPGPGGTPESFHVYSMRQAIEEGFILDVLQHYIDYDAYYRLVKQAEDDPEFPKRRTAVALAKFMTLHPHNIGQKTAVIIEHFRNNVRRRIGGKAKAMVVTSSRLHAVRYMQSFKGYIAEHDYDDVRPLVAFSGTVRDPDSGEEFTEPGMNLDIVTGKPISESALPSRFASSDYQILLVAEKYQTGFDQPLLQAMYVDKRLDGVQAVQTLSRLNRVALGKAPPFVLDFVNDPEDIREAFAPYYDRTETAGRLRPAPARGAEARTRRDAGLPPRRGRGVRAHLLPAAGAEAAGRPCAPRSAAAARRRPLPGAGSGRPGSVRGPSGRVREALRLPEPDHSLRRQRSGAALVVRAFPAPPPPTRPRRRRYSPQRRRGACVLPPGASFGRRDQPQGRRGRIRDDPDCRGHRRPRGGSGAALGDHRASQRALRHGLHGRGSPVLRASEGAWRPQRRYPSDGPREPL